jgi:hypothetical protein
MRTLVDERQELEDENAKQFDANGILKDGGRIRRPLYLCDAAPMDGRVEDAFRAGYARGLADGRKTATVRDPPAAPHKRPAHDSAPTVEDALTRLRTQADKRAELIADAAEVKDAARAEMIGDMLGAWKNDTPSDAPPPSGRTDAMPTADAREQAWLELQQQTRDAWRSDQP